MVGFVNLAFYCNELQVNNQTDLIIIFLADGWHPSNTKHSAMAFFISCLLRGQGDWMISPATIDANTTNASVDKNYKWPCGNDNEEIGLSKDRFMMRHHCQVGDHLCVQLLLRRLYADLIGSRQLISNFYDSDEIKTIRDVSITCCNTEHYQVPLDSNYTKVTIPKHADPMKNVSSLFLGFRKQDSHFDMMKVHIKSSKDRNVAEYVNGKLIWPENWGCFWNWPTTNYFTTWFACEENQVEVSSIYMCEESKKCQDEGQSGSALKVLAVYG